VEPWPGRASGGWARAREDQPRDGSELWVRYLLEGYDARFAPRFLEAMAAAAESGRPDRWFAPGEGKTQTAGLGSSEAGAESLDRLLRSPEVTRGLDGWLADPLVGQAVVEPEPEGTVPDGRRREMLLVLKLAHRFAAPVPPAIRPKILVDGEDRSADFLPQPRPPAPEAVADLFGRLTDARRPAWATLDTDGSLLLSDDRQRVAELLRPLDRRYRTFRRDGALVLEARFASGEVYEAWLERDEKNPNRPIAHVQRRATPQFGSVEGPGGKTES
jgi:hypothetical protein